MTPRARDWLFSVTAFLSAFLLFAAQPMIGRMALPRLGGSPAVWLSCQLFFQAALLAGYLYAHLTTTRLAAAVQGRLHLALLFAGALALPLALSGDWAASDAGSPAARLVAALARRGGLPLLAVCASAPLLQRWLSRGGREPYFLYAASNAGSFAALACYPFLIEPFVRLGAQSRWWSAGYALFAALTAACLYASRPSGAAAVPAAAPEEADAEPVTLARKLGWLALSFVPASVSLGATTYMTANIAPVPLFWAIPLAVYLASFIYAFSRRPAALTAGVNWMLPLLLVFAMKTFAAPVDLQLVPIFMIHLQTLAALAVVLHCRLADDRPPESGLTEYYLWISVGGALAGLFNAVVAPLWLKMPLEYPISLALGVLLVPVYEEARGRRLASCVAGGLALLLSLSGMPGRVGFSLFDMGALALLYATASLRLDPRPGLAAFCLYAGWLAFSGNGAFKLDRSFFGTIQLSDSTSEEGERLRQLRHGNTTHGVQSFDRPDEPTTYYHTGSGVGRLLHGMCDKRGCPRTAVIGLGAGTLAAYAGKGFQLDFYEIDPMIAKLSEASTFTFLSNARKRGAVVRVIMGDGRLKMEQAPDGHYSLIVVDGFGSDSIPTHLLTKEAMALYLRKLAPDGVVAVHVSNRYLRLGPVVADIVRELGLAGLLHSTDDEGEAMHGSHWVAVARRKDVLAKLKVQDGWMPLTGVPGRAAWEDERIDLMSSASF